MTQDQIMMLAHLADWAGSKMAPDNPFAGYAQQYVASRNFAKMLQNPQAGVPGVTPESAGGVVAPEASALAKPNPFAPESVGTGAGYNFGNTPVVTEGNKNAVGLGVDQIFEVGVDARVDRDNNVTVSRKFPAQVQAGAPEKKQAPNQLPQSVTNPFWALS